MEKKKRSKMKTVLRLLLLLLLLRINKCISKEGEVEKGGVRESYFYTITTIVIINYLLNVRHKLTKNIIHNVVSLELYLQEFSS